MATHRWNSTAIFLLIFFVAVLVIHIEAKSVATKKNCNFETCKQLEGKNITCDEEISDALKCFTALNKDCADDPRIEYYMEKHKLIQEVLCKKGLPGAEFKNDGICWPDAEECLKSIVTPERMLKGKVCDAKKANNDQCKVKPSIKDECKVSHAIFLERAFQVSQCQGSNFTIHILLFISGLFFASVGVIGR